MVKAKIRNTILRKSLGWATRGLSCLQYQREPQEDAPNQQWPCISCVSVSKCHYIVLSSECRFLHCDLINQKTWLTAGLIGNILARKFGKYYLYYAYLFIQQKGQRYRNNTAREQFPVYFCCEIHLISFFFSQLTLFRKILMTIVYLTSSQRKRPSLQSFYELPSRPSSPTFNIY